MNTPIKLEADLIHILRHTHDLWEALRGKTIFVTGGTGFFGIWLTESFLYANEALGLGAKMITLTRNKAAFLARQPHLADNTALAFVEGDVKDFASPEAPLHYIIHAATEADAALNTEHPLVMLDTITAGTRRALDLAAEKQVTAFMLTSSGAVYGRQPAEVTHIAEDESYKTDINDPANAYAEGKRLAELYCATYHRHYGLPVKIARCFAFVGPYLPLDKHFAIGNFIRHALRRENIVIKGDGTPYRSYLHAADLAIWLWTILLKGENNVPYNVGSDDDYSIEGIAALVAGEAPMPIQYAVLGAKTGGPVARYVPSVRRAAGALGLSVTIPIKEAIKKTIEFYTAAAGTP